MLVVFLLAGQRESGMSNEPKEVTLPDSGATVRVKFVGPMLLNDIRKAAGKGLAKPAPPLIAPFEDKSVTEPNEDDPAYTAALAEYNTALGMRFLEKLFRYGVDYTLTPADVAQVAALRADADLDLPADDFQVFVTRFLVKTNADLEALQGAIMGYSQPTEAQVAASIESFPA